MIVQTRGLVVGDLDGCGTGEDERNIEGLSVGEEIEGDIVGEWVGIVDGIFDGKSHCKKGICPSW